MSTGKDEMPAKPRALNTGTWTRRPSRVGKFVEVKLQSRPFTGLRRNPKPLRKTKTP